MKDKHTHYRDETSIKRTAPCGVVIYGTLGADYLPVGPNPPSSSNLWPRVTCPDCLKHKPEKKQSKADMEAADRAAVVRAMVKERGLSRAEFASLGGFSARTIDRIYNGSRALSELERRGLESLPRKRGRKKSR